MNTKIKAYRGIAIVLSLFGVAAILFSMFSDYNEHNYALLIGLGSINIANILHCFSYRMKQQHPSLSNQITAKKALPTAIVSNACIFFEIIFTPTR